MSKVYKCIKCDKKYVFSDGVGFSFPSVIYETVRDIKEGKYGPEIKEVIENNAEVAVDASNKIYYCKSCGYWDVEKALDCYISKSHSESVKKNSQWSTVEPSGGLDPYDYSKIKIVPPWNLEKNYKLLMNYDHICPKCGKKMTGYKKPPTEKVIDGVETLKIKCNECGRTIISTDEEICFD